MGRTILVSHRLPYSLVIKDQSYHLDTSVGGLATGLMPLLSEGNLWLGWSGSNKKVGAKMRESIQKDFEARGCIPIEFPDKEHHLFLDDMCNGILWPLYHYQVGLLPLKFEGWDDYEAINRRVAEKIRELAKPGDLIWIQDYHFQLLPAMIRDMDLDVKIGFFLHIPFPTYEMFRILPWRKQILKGLLGADVIGFHTEEYGEHFKECARQILNLETHGSIIQGLEHEVSVNHFPLGVDTSELQKDFEGDDTLAKSLHQVREEHPELKIFLSVDRMDYTKGLIRKLLSFEHLLETNPSLRGKIMLVQIAPPSRGDVPAYKQFRRQIDEHVGRINGKFSTPMYQPIFYLTRSFHPLEIYRVYKDVDVMLVTPVRDGMNLVAKEFVAARDDDDGVLVLSEFAGAASELHEALQINPYDILEMAKTFKNAVAMPKAEREARMKALREKVIHFQTSDWAKTFLDQLASTPARIRKARFDQPAVLAAEIAKESAPLDITLDYDGTLFPIVKVPGKAIPDEELRSLLKNLSEVSRLHIVSGRPMHELKSWFAGLPLHLHAEHGAINEYQGESRTGCERETIRRLGQGLEKIASHYSGSRVEIKNFSVCFHTRGVNPVLQDKAALEVKGFIEDFYPELEVLEGKKTIEGRYAHLNKGAVIRDLIAKSESDHASTCLVAIGDDRTDEDMFQAIPQNGYSVVVGNHNSKARYRLRDSDDVRLLLRSLTERLKSRAEEDHAADLAPKIRSSTTQSLPKFENSL